MPRRWSLAVLVLFVVGMLAAGALGGAVTAPAIPAWYAGLAKPWFNPPTWVFAPVWTVLYLMIAVAGWRIWRLPPSRARSIGLALWAVQLVLNMAWSPAFFGLRSPSLGLMVIVPLGLAILAAITAFRRLDAPAALLFVPYLAWVCFAGLLNAAIWRLN